MITACACMLCLYIVTVTQYLVFVVGDGSLHAVSMMDHNVHVHALCILGSNMIFRLG